MRAYILVVMRVIMPKSYRARVSYLPLPIDPATGKSRPVTDKDPLLTLPDLSQPVPDDWVTIEDKFYLVYALNLSLLDPMTLLCPQSKAECPSALLKIGLFGKKLKYFDRLTRVEFEREGEKWIKLLKVLTRHGANIPRSKVHM